ncbi:hypothetical protein F2P56_020054 [Juglans regia]|uniref:Mitochondrial protein n=2 Tax=Juglans regia TaxID=51240 RepID=A0A833UQ30_JUGRE|nr:uncharacterized mitochondrial protein AtMg00810-like [Juglans regia]KAF5460167.1 hypothetical protein F2P56_020054 [Juglans regia]
MDLAKPATSPMFASAPLTLADGPTFEDPTLYRSTIGSLQYLSLTCPDVAYAVNIRAVKRILRYLKHTAHLGLHIKPFPEYTLHAFTDTDWAGCPNDRRSTRGFCIFLGSNLLS